jgi:hypothetical protein
MLIERTAHSGPLSFLKELSQVGAVVGLWCISAMGHSRGSGKQSSTGKITMTINTNDDKNIPIETEAYYEAFAGQEEIYLEATEEEVRAILASDDQSPERTTAKYWRSKIEELELDWEIEIP